MKDNKELNINSTVNNNFINKLHLSNMDVFDHNVKRSNIKSPLRRYDINDNSINEISIFENQDCQVNSNFLKDNKAINDIVCRNSNNPPSIININININNINNKKNSKIKNNFLKVLSAKDNNISIDENNNNNNNINNNMLVINKSLTPYRNNISNSYSNKINLRSILKNDHNNRGIKYKGNDSIFKNMVIRSPKLAYNILIYTDIETLFNTLLLNKEIFYHLCNNKVVQDNLEINLKINYQQILYLKEFYWFRSQNVILSQINNDIEFCIDEFNAKESSLTNFWIYSFFILIFNCFVLMICLIIEGVLDISNDINDTNQNNIIINNTNTTSVHNSLDTDCSVYESTSVIKNSIHKLWIPLLPLSIFWFISIVTLIKLLISKLFYYEKIKNKIKTLLTEHSIFTEKRTEYLYNEYIYKNKNISNHILSEYLFIIVILLCPIILNYNFELNDNISLETLFKISSIPVFSLLYLKDIYVISLKNRFFSKDSKLSQYRYLIDTSNTDYLTEKLNEDIKDIRKSKLFLSEIILSIIFLLLKLAFYSMIVVYLSHLSRKIEFSNNDFLSSDSGNNSPLWLIFFIPLYIFFLIYLFYIILEVHSKTSSCKDFVICLISSLVFYLCFLASSIIFPLILENNNFANCYIVISLISFGSIYMSMHYYCIYKE